MKVNPLTIFSRDSYTCGLCAQVFQDGSLVPHHRANRGMGSNPKANRPSNVLSLCSLCNGLIEADAVQATRARILGIKISKFDAQIAHLVPVNVLLGAEREWVLLDDRYGMTVTDNPNDGVAN